MQIHIAVKEVRIDAFEMACELTLELGIFSGSIVFNEMRSSTEPTRFQELTSSHNLKLTDEPKAYFQYHDHLMGVHHFD